MARRSANEWYVAMVDDLAERLPLWRRNLQINDIRIWIPREEIWRLIDGHWTDASEIMLPGYVLASSVIGPQYIETVLGVCLLRSGKQYASIGYEEIANLRWRQNRASYILDHVFKPGQEVMVREDARSSYSGMRGIFHCPLVIDFGYQARVTMLLFESRNPTVVLPYDHLISCTEENLLEKKENIGRYPFPLDGRWIGSKKTLVLTKNEVGYGRI